MIPFCRHEWEKVTEHIFPSIHEQLEAKGTDALIRLRRLDPALFEKKYILVLKCLKCGKIHTTFTVIA